MAFLIANATSTHRPSIPAAPHLQATLLITALTFLKRSFLKRCNTTRYHTKIALTVSAVITIVFAGVALAANSIWSANYYGETWFHQLADAQHSAQNANKPILLYVSASEFCRACRTLDKKVLTQTAFQNYAKTNLTLMNIDVPENGDTPAEHKELMKKFGVRNFPTIVMISPDGQGITKFKGCSFFSCSEKRLMEKVKKGMLAYNQYQSGHVSAYYTQSD